jgi:YidC/Oxa1 family membrane protein insertase
VVAGRLRSGGAAVIFNDIVIWDQIIAALVWLLNHYYDWIGSWGWSIVLLTFTIRLAMLPLTIRQFRSMAAMQIVQPKVKQLQNRYKGKSSREDKQKMQQELMQLYKEHNVNPFGSCLPLLIQAPVFIALNATLRFHIHPAGDQAFLGINNIFVKLNELTPAAEYTLIALYVGSMLGSTLLFSFVTDRQQKYMLAAMPIVFVPFVLNFTTGVMIYWITSNFWTIGQQGMIKRTMGHRFPQPVAKAGKGGSSGKGASTSKSGGKPKPGADGGKAAGGKPKPGTDGGKPVDESGATPPPRRGSGRRSSQQPGRRSGQRRGGRKR